ncbi:MAG: SPOR domain-containing protein [Candidatus Methylomirabilales bacterium]
MEVAPQRAKPKPTERVARAEKPPTQTRVQKPSSPTLQTIPAQGKGPFTVQVASLVINRNALALKKRLAQLGYTPVVHMTTSLISQHRVSVGEFVSHDEAERTARRLNVDGFPSNMVKGGDGKFRLEVGSYYNLNKAIDLAHTLQEKNYTPKVASKAVPTPVHQVRVGEYESRAEALKALEALKKQGFAPIIVKR